MSRRSFSDAPPSPDQNAPPPSSPPGAEPRCLFLAGRGGHGKTLLLRWLAERAFAAGRPLVIADGDRTNRVLPHYFHDVLHPPSAGEQAVMHWLEAILERMAAQRFTLAVDLGGGDQVLKRLAMEAGLQEVLQQAGLTPAILHLLGPDVESLGYLAALEAPVTAPGAEAAGPPLFAPACTALVLNTGLVPDPGADLVAEFAALREHAVFAAAAARGAAAIVMPRLPCALEINRRHLAFAAAAAGETKPGLPPLGLFDRTRVRLWLRDMEAAFAPVAGWLP